MAYTNTGYIPGLPTPPPAPRASTGSVFTNAATNAAVAGATGGPQAAAISGGASLISGLLGNKGSNRAAQAQERAAAEALAYQREQDAKEEQRYREQQAALKAQWEAQQQQRAPFRAAAEALLRQNASRMGLNMPTSSTPPTMPAGWTPDSAGALARPKTLSSLAGMSDTTPVMSAPQLTISDILNGSWSQRRA
jgi:hypothetical protein